MNQNFKLQFLISLLISINLILSSPLPLPAKDRQQIIKDSGIDPKQTTSGAQLAELIKKVKDDGLITIPKDALGVIKKLSTNPELSSDDKKILHNCRDAASKNNSASRDRDDKATPTGQIYFVTNKLTLRACGAALGDGKDNQLIAAIVVNLLIRIAEVKEKNEPLPKIDPVTL